MRRSYFFWTGVLMAGVGLCCGAGQAQDTRTVTEPKIPPVCTTLEAKLSSSDGTFSDADESKLDTERIQKAIDGCGAGKAVELQMEIDPNTASQKGARGGKVWNAFLTGPLELHEGVTLLIDKGVTLYGSRDPKVYEFPDPNRKPDDPITCGTSRPRPTSFPAPTSQTPPSSGATSQTPRPRGGCRSLITVNVKNAAIMGEGAIDGRGYAKLIGHDYSWWQMARKAQPNDDLYFATRLIVASHADGFILYKIHLLNSPNFHVSVNQTDGFTAWGVHLVTPVDKKLIGTDNDARNTDGIDPGSSQNITITHSWIDNGDDNVAIKQGVSHMSVIDNHFYTGHGMSIGSETVLGQSYLLVDGLTEDHTTSGIRIKSNVMRGGPVHDLVYKNICMKDVPIPIAISPYYTNQTVEPFEDPKYKGDRIPDYKKITLENIYSTTPGDVLIAGLNDQHRTEVSLDAVHIEGIKPSQLHLAYADIHMKVCSAYSKSPGTNLPLDQVPATVKVIPSPEDGCGVVPIHPVDACAGKFVPMQ